MKKAMLSFALIFLCLALCACGNHGGAGEKEVLFDNVLEHSIIDDNVSVMTFYKDGTVVSRCDRIYDNSHIDNIGIDGINDFHIDSICYRVEGTYTVEGDIYQTHFNKYYVKFIASGADKDKLITYAKGSEDDFGKRNGDLLYYYKYAEGEDYVLLPSNIVDYGYYVMDDYYGLLIDRSMGIRFTNASRISKNGLQQYSNMDYDEIQMCFLPVHVSITGRGSGICDYEYYDNGKTKSKVELYKGKTYKYEYNENGKEILYEIYDENGELEHRRVD